MSHDPCQTQTEHADSFGSYSVDNFHLVFFFWIYAKAKTLDAIPFVGEERRFSTPILLLEGHQRMRILHRIVTGDENRKMKKYFAKPGEPVPSTSTLTTMKNIHSSKVINKMRV